MTIYRVGHTEHSYSWILTVASSAEEATRTWQEMAATDDADWVGLAPDDVVEMGKTVVLDDGGRKITF